MRVALKASPDPQRLFPAAAEAPPPALLAPTGPDLVLGACPSPDGLPLPVAPSAGSLFGPRGACLAAEDGPLWVADSGHHRLLGWRELPRADNALADWVIGQADFVCEGRNAKALPGPATLNVPTGVVAGANGLIVADAWNHRVLIWHALPEDSHVPADLVLGQADFAGGEVNRGRGEAGAETLNWPYGVATDGERLIVADTGNRRVLIWDAMPQSNGQPADRVLGQVAFDRRDENAGHAPDAMSLRWPHDVVLHEGALFVADAGNNRVMVWRDLPETPGAPCDLVLGQGDFSATDHNRSHYWPDATCLNMPYGLSVAGSWLLVADTASSRLLGWPIDALTTGGPALALTGQPDFQAKGDNRWQAAVRDSLCWPYAVKACGETVVVADSGNNRVLVWRLAA